MGYVYKGTDHDLDEPVNARTPSTPGPKPSGFLPEKCGTTAGFKQHYRYDVPVCEACKEANRAYRRGLRKPRELKPCGTHAAYRRHIVEGTEPCTACNEANNAYNREYAQDHPTPIGRFDASACGTYKGYRRHTRRGLKPCDACRVAGNAYMADYRARRAA